VSGVTPSEPVSPPYYALPTGDRASAIADLQSIAWDLAFVAEACGAIRALPSDRTGQDNVVGRALWEAAVIAYRRSFSTGRGHGAARTRLRLDKDFVNSLSDAARETHEALMDEADRHVAHRVGDREQIKVAVLLNPPPGDQRVLDVLFWGARNLGGGTRVDDLADLAKRLLEAVALDTKVIASQLCAEVNADLANVYAHASPMPPAPSPATE
jgi:hypothetical protein